MLIVITGPTASGKSELAHKLAKEYGREIISADSMQIYRGMDIGTAKSPQYFEGVNTRLIDIIEPSEEYSVQRFVSDADLQIQRLGGEAIISGGTGYFIRALLYSYDFSPPVRNPEATSRYLELAKTKGNEYLYGLLTEIDPASAEKLHPNDLKRIIRALEIAESGRKKSEIIPAASLERRYAYKMFVLDPPREALYERINTRVDRMFAAGLVDEVSSLTADGLLRTAQSMQAIGYKEVAAHLSGELSLTEAKELIKKRTRNYAKRQMTFFRGFPEAVFLDPLTAYEKISEVMN